MIIAIVSTALAIVLFIIAFLGFRTGLRLGMQTAKGQIPPKVDPVGAVINKVAEIKHDAQTNELLRGFANMMSYNGDPPKDER